MTWAIVKVLPVPVAPKRVGVRLTTLHGAHQRIDGRRLVASRTELGLDLERRHPTESKWTRGHGLHPYTRRRAHLSRLWCREPGAITLLYGVRHPAGCSGSGGGTAARHRAVRRHRRVHERFEHADPEDISAVLRTFHLRTRREIEGFGGTVDKVAGDVVFGVFGTPTTHEDDAERALRAALSIMQRTRERDDTDVARSLGVRIGIATGEAMVSVGKGPRVGERVTGDVVNLASRLRSTGRAELHRGRGEHVPGYPFAVPLEELGAIDVRGKADQVRIWRPIEPLARVGVEPPGPLGAPFTGRAMELDDLRRVFEQARGDRHPTMVTIVREPGLGKSRLIAELSRYTDDLPDLIRWRGRGGPRPTARSPRSARSRTS